MTKQAQSIFVANVAGNLKGDRDPTILGPLTLIVGDNDSGKTRITQLVELAIAGKVSKRDGSGEMARGVDLLALAPAGSDRLWSTADLSNGDRCRTAIQGSTAAAHDPVREGPSWILNAAYADLFPARHVAQALMGSPASLRKEILTAVGASVSLDAVIAAIPEGIDLIEADASPIDRLIATREVLAQRMRKHRADANTIEAEASRKLTQAPRVDLADLEAAVVKAEAQIAEADAAVGNAKHDAEAQIAAQGADPDAIARSVLDHAEAVIRASIEEDLDSCIACGASVTASALRVQLAYVRTVLKKITADQAAWVQRKDAIWREINTATRSARDREASARRICAEAREALAHARGRTEATATAQNDGAARARDMRDMAARLAIHVDGCDLALTRIIESAVAGFKDRVQAIYGGQDEIAIQIRDGNREVCQIGLLRDGRIHTEIGGAAWARMIAAFAGSMPRRSPLRILIMPDVGFTLGTVTAGMRAIKEAYDAAAFTQVLWPWASTMDPDQIAVPGWTIVNAGS